MSGLSRRTFLAGAGAAALTATTKPTFANLALPNTAVRLKESATKIDTTIVLMQENRSVDHYLGWYHDLNPDFDGTQDASYPDADGNLVSTKSWGKEGENEFAGCGYNDPGHGWESGRAQKANGFLAAGSGNDKFALSTYDADDVPVHAALLERFTTFDSYFCSVLTSTYPNREYLHSCQGLDNNDFPPERANENPVWLTGFDWPTIWDALTANGVTWAYYFSNLPVIALWGPRYLYGCRHISNFYADAAAGQLPQVCFVDPWFVAPDGLANDDHPHADLRLGQQFLSGVVTSVLESPQWPEAALFITYDEWGGFWDHVTPPTVPDPRADPDGGGFGELGFRVPTIVASPWVGEGGVDHTLLDHTSIVRFILENYSIDPRLDPKARVAVNSIASAFDFAGEPDLNVNVEKFRYAAPQEAFTTGCTLREANQSISDLFRLAENGWFDTFGFRTDWRFEDSFRR